MQITYQYFYTERREPRVTVCYVKSSGYLDVGVSICSWRDRPNKALGRIIARGRALKCKNARVCCDVWQSRPCGRRAERVLAETDMAIEGQSIIVSDVCGMAFSSDDPSWRFTRDRSGFFPRIVCLCGSTRFKDEFVRQNFQETMQGRIVLSIGCAMRSNAELFGHLSSEKRYEVKAKLDELHKRKIDLAHEILVLDVDGYIGVSTAGEIAYAKLNGKRVRYLSKEQR